MRGIFGYFAVTALVVSVCVTPHQTYADTIGFGTTWSLPGAIQFETPIGGGLPPIVPGASTAGVGSPFEDTMFALDAQAGVSQFHPDWGTLTSVSIAIGGTGVYNYSYSPEIPDIGNPSINGASFFAKTSIDQSALGIHDEDENTGGSPGGGGAIITNVEFEGPVPGIGGGIVGFGTILFDLHHEISGSIFADADGDGFPDAGWEGAMSGVFGGTIAIVYNFIPATSPDGGPPNGTGSCLSCGPLPGDTDLDGFVGVDDLNLVLANWNLNVFGWNNGDFNTDGFVGIDDLNFVLTNWNAGTPPLASATIPEPSTTLLLVGGVAGYIQCRFRSSQEN